MSWLFVAITIVLVAVLSYYLTLTTRPEISRITPAPNSAQSPGPVNIGALVTAQDDLDHVQFIVDGQEVSPRVEQRGQDEWWISYEDVFERGEREVVIQVTDASGRTTEHSWHFQSAGDLLPPRLALVAPPLDATLESGLGAITIHATTFAEVDSAEVRIDGEPIEVEISELESEASEYSADGDLSVHEWEVTGIAQFNAGSLEVRATITDTNGAGATESWTIATSATPSEADAHFIMESRQYIEEPIYSFWRENNGEEVFGPPISATLPDENGDMRQFFRFARIEVDSEGDVHLGLIGREVFGNPEERPERAPGEGARRFDPTGHYIRGPIRQFWEDNGGLAIFGYPISQEFETSDGYAQYFERALIEVAESGGDEFEVSLAPLGEHVYEQLQRTDPEQSEPSPR